MAKWLMILATCACICGCAHTQPNVFVGTEDGKDIPKIWWGKAGDSPSDSTKLWKKYNWVLTAQDEY